MARAADSRELTASITGRHAPPRRWGGGAFDIGLATDADEPELRQLLRDQPIGGQVQLTLEREPCLYHAAGIEGDRYHLAVVRDRLTGRVVGMGSRSVREVWVDGRVTKLGYLGLLRRDPAVGRRWALLSSGFDCLQRTHLPDELPYNFTSIVSDNAPARRLLERGLPGLPRYEPAGGFVTFVVPAHRRHRIPRSLPIVRGQEGLVPSIIACLQRNLRRYEGAPLWTTQHLRDPLRCRGLALSDFFLAYSRDRVIGCLALWDQRPFKQVVVRGYGSPLRYTRPAINAWMRLTGRPRLPRPVRQLNTAYLSHVAIDADRPDVFFGLVQAAQAAAVDRSIDYVLLGLADDHPLTRAVQKAWNARAYHSTLYRVHWPNTGRSRWAATGVFHPEVAIL